MSQEPKKGSDLRVKEETLLQTMGQEPHLAKA